MMEWLYSDSEMISPARKAPRARDNPIKWVSQATARQIRMAPRIKSSGMRVRVIWKRIQGTSLPGAESHQQGDPDPLGQKN